MRKLLLAAFIILGFVSAANAVPMYGYVQITTTTALTPALQSGAINISSGTIRTLTVSTVAVTTSFSGGSNRLTNVSTPTAVTDAATKGYVDSLGANSTNYIQNTSTPQSATFNVSSGTATNFIAVSSTMTTISVTTITPTGIVGTTTNNNANPGNVGEYVENIFSGVTSGGSGTYLVVSTITLTAGDWDISMNAVLTASVAGSNSVWSMCISATSGNNTTGCVQGSNWAALMPGISTPSVTNDGRAIANWRQSINSSVPYYGKMSATFTSGTWQWYGRLSARRMR
jgi:hypothetical protein